MSDTATEASADVGVTVLLTSDTPPTPNRVPNKTLSSTYCAPSLSNPDRYNLGFLFSNNKKMGYLHWDSQAQSLNGEGGLWRHLGVELQKWQLELGSIAELFCFIHEKFAKTFFSQLKKYRKRSSFQIAVPISRSETRSPEPSKSETDRPEVEEVFWAWMTVSTHRNGAGSPQVDILAYAMEAFPRLTQSEQLRLGAWHVLLNKGTFGTYYWTISENRIHSYPCCWQRIGFSQQEAEHFAGGEPMKRWIGRIHPEDYVKVRQVVQSAILEKEPFTLLYRVADRQQRYRWIQSEDQAVFNNKGELIALVGTVFDRDKERFNELFLQEQISQLQEANEMESDRLHKLSAHINTPMNTILGYSQWFDLQTQLPKKQRERINHIKDAGEHLLQLINEVIDLSKVEAGQLELNLTQVNITQLIRECLALCQPLIYRRRIRVITHFREQDFWQVEADRLRLKQVFLNLISNAAKYNDECGWIRIRITFKGSQFLSVVVEDGGWGMTEEQQSQLFQPYNRLGAESTSVEGSGLGLAISQKLIHMMGGEITCSSEVGQGSSFTVNLQQRLTEKDNEKFSSSFSSQNAGVEFLENWNDYPFYSFSLRGAVKVGALNREGVLFEEKTPEEDLEDSTPSQSSLGVFNSCVRKVLYLDKNSNTTRLLEQWMESAPNVELIKVESIQLALYQIRVQSLDLLLIDYDGFFSFLGEAPDAANDKDFLEFLLGGDDLIDHLIEDLPVLALSTPQSETLVQSRYPHLNKLINKTLHKPLNMKDFFDSLAELLGL